MSEAEDDEPLTMEDRLQVLAWRLQDATEDLNDSIRKVEEALAERRYPPSSAPVPTFEERVIGPCTRKVSGHTLHWDGRHLIYDNGKHKVPLLNASRAMRVRSVDVLPALFPRCGHTEA